MKLFTYRGIRVRAFHRHIRGITWFIWWFPSLFAIGNYCYLNLEELKDHPLPQVYFIGGYPCCFLLSGLPTKSHVLRENRLLPEAQ